MRASILISFFILLTMGVYAQNGNGKGNGGGGTVTPYSVPNCGSAPVGTDGSRCGTGAVTLHTNTPPSGYIVKWYATPTSSQNLWDGGNDFTTPSLSSTTAYYAAFYNTSTGCETSRTTVTAYILTAVTPANAGSNQTKCYASTNMAANSPGAGETGSWSISSGPSTSLLQLSSTTNPSATFTPSGGSGSYVFVWTLTNGSCSSSSSVTITLNSLPAAPSVTTPAAICAGNITAINSTVGSGGSNVNWYSSSSGGTSLYTGTTFTTPTLNNNTTYYAESVSSSGCPSSTRTAVTVTVNAVPAAPVSGTQGHTCYQVDQPGTGYVSAVPGSGADNIQWYLGGSPLTPLGLSYLGSTSSTTTYTAYSYNSSTGCRSATGINVRLFGDPTPTYPTISGGGSSCGTSVFNLSATVGTNGDQIKWYGPSGYITTSASYSPTVSSSTTYYATTYNSTSGCESGQKPVSITINSVPAAPSVTTPPVICFSGSASINATVGAGGNNIYWYTAATGGSSQYSGSPYPTPVISTTTSYYAETESASGCPSATRTQVTVTVGTEPIPNNLSSTLVCGTGTSLITGSPGTGTALKFYDGTATNSFLYTQSPVTSYTTGSISSSQTYYAASYNGNTGCETQAAHRVAVGVTERPVPSVSSSGNQSFCGPATTSVVLTNNLPNTVNTWTVSSSNVSGASASAGTSSSSSPYTYTLAQNLSPSGTVPGTATYTVTPSLNGCTGTPITVSATMSPKPTITVTNNVPTFCSVGTTSINITNTSGLPSTTYSWSLTGVSSNLAGATSATNTSATSIAQSLSTTTGSPGSVTYVISASTPYCQSTSTSTTVTVNPTPNAATQSSQTICSGSPASMIITNPNNVSGTSFAWTTAATNASFATASGTGNIYDTFTNADGVNQGSVTYTITPATANCTGTPITATVTVYDMPTTPTPSSYIGYGSANATLQLAVPEGLQARWYPDLFNPTPLGTSPTLVYANNSATQLCVSMKNLSTGCETQRAPVTVNFLPTIAPNSVTVETVRIAGQAVEGDVIGLSTSQKAVTVSFLDGLSRTNQIVSLNATPSGKDLVRPVEYDSYGRTSKDYLPYSAATNASFQNNYTSAQSAFYSAGNDKIADDSYPYAVASYEASPLGRVLVQGQVGQAWQPGLHAKQVSYAYNTGATSSDQEEVRQFASDGSSTGFYALNTLTKATVTDENGNLDIVFKNAVGNTVARKQQAANSTWLQTYYIYDSFNQLKYIVPPAAISQLKTANWSVPANFFDTWCFQFSYDNRGRLIQKKTPGQAWTYYAYDKMNRLVLSQDGNLRQQGKWSFVKYDLRGRSVITGLYTNASLTDQSTAQTLVNSQFGTGVPYFESRTSATGFYGYTNQAFPNSSVEVWSVVYYDDYNFLLNGSAPTYDNTHLAGLPSTASIYTRGRVTGGSKLIVGTTNMLTSAMFYDNYGRVIQVQGNNHLRLNGLDKTSTTYDFEKVIQTKTTHSPDGVNFTTILQTPVYDAQGRVSQMKHSINGATDQIVAQYAYNELGQVVMKQLHNNGGNYLQNVDYRYNIRGWLTSINNAQLANDSNITNGDTNDFFGMELLYNTVQTGLNDQVNDKVYHNGNVSALKWKGAGAATGAVGQRSYKYNYDQADRLTAAVFQKSNTGTDWSAEAGTLNETMSYDLNGNIVNLQRNQKQRGLIGTTVTSTVQAIDNLTYTYANGGNQLTKVEDASLTAGFNNGNTSGNDYSYDSHGNLTQDLNKGINAIAYNVLGKPQQITFSDGRSVNYTYDAGGNKLTMATTVSGATTTTDYTSGFVYNTVSGTRTLAFISSPEGRVVKNASGYEYQYAIADHQGNTRILFTSAPQTPVSTLADFEGDTADQSGQFTNVPAAIPYSAANNTPGGNKVIRMNQANPVAMGLSKKVYPGDKVDLEVYSYYEAGSGYGTTNTAVATLISSVTTALVAGGPDYGGLKSSGVNSALTNFGTGANQGDTQPAAFLNYILFDQNYSVMDAGWQVVPATSFSKQYVSIPTITVKEAGYIFAYLSYEDQSNNYVYFDDFKVTVTPTPVLQGSDYYAFGLQHNTSWTRDNTTNNFLYNEGSELNNTTGMYDLPNRNYDAALGRFFQADPLAHMDHTLTPYHYAGNNPIGSNDPSGLMRVSEAPIYNPETGGGGGHDGWSNDSNLGDSYGNYNGDEMYQMNKDAALVRAGMMDASEYAEKWSDTPNGSNGAYALVEYGYNTKVSSDGGKTWEESGWSTDHFEVEFVSLDYGESPSGGLTQSDDDPDLSSDARSWKYIRVGPGGNYQATGVSGVYFDYITSYSGSDGKYHVDYVKYTFNTLFFEFPAVRADGTIITPAEAAMISAAAKDLAEENVETLLGNEPRPLTSVLENTFLTELRATLAPFGGRVSLTPNYGPVPISPYSKTLFGNGR